MHDEALAWAESVLGAAVTEKVALPGGKTSVMLALTDASGRPSVLRLMTNEPWRAHGADLTRRERAAQRELLWTRVSAPTSLGLDEKGQSTGGVAAHLMSRLSGGPTRNIEDDAAATMADMLARIHDVRPAVPFRCYQSWAWGAKWVIPPWTNHPESWQGAFDVLAEDPPSHEPTFLHRDYSHRNLLWENDAISGVVDWVETSTGPAWLDAGHAATNLAIAYGPEPARSFIAAYAAVTGRKLDRYWLIMDAVGFLPPPGREPMFGAPAELARLDGWLNEVVRSPTSI